MKTDVKTDHYVRVANFLAGIGHATPEAPRLASRKVLCTWGRLLVEEVFEYLESAGVRVIARGDQDRPLCFAELDFEIDEEVSPDLLGICDACADISVVNTGAMVLNGIADTAVLDVVDTNNLLKLATGTLDPVTGKFKKAPDHPRPDFQQVLFDQGYLSTGSS